MLPANEVVQFCSIVSNVKWGGSSHLLMKPEWSQLSIVAFTVLQREMVLIF